MYEHRDEGFGEGCTHTLGSSAVYVTSHFCLHGGFASQMQTLLPGTSGTGSDRGLVFILRPEQTMCTWYLETKEAKPVQNVAIPLSYSERGNFLSEFICGNPRKITLVRLFIMSAVYLIGVFQCKRGRKSSLRTSPSQLHIIVGRGGGRLVLREVQGLESGQQWVSGAREQGALNAFAHSAKVCSEEADSGGREVL